MTTAAFQPTRDRVFGSYDYPTNDGRPMGETDWHRIAMVESIETLQAWYEGQQVYVSGNLLLCYEQGNRRKHVSPDVMVVKGARVGVRLNYLLWEEGLPPNVVIEITSATTRQEDLTKKFEIYRTEIGVREYFLFDPLDDYLKPRLQGFRLIDGEYVPIELQDRRLPSEELGLSLEACEYKIRFFDQARGVQLPTFQELWHAEQLKNQQLQAEVEALRNKAAEGGR